MIDLFIFNRNVCNGYGYLNIHKTEILPRIPTIVPIPYN